MIERPERFERSPDDGTFHQALTQQLQQAFDAMAAQYLARVVERQSAYLDAFLRDELTHLVNRLLEGVVDQVAERVSERLARSERPERSMAPALPSTADATKPQNRPAMPEPKTALLQRLRTMQAEGLSLQAIAD